MGRLMLPLKLNEPVERISLLLESIVQCNFNVYVCYYFSKYIVFKVMTKSQFLANPAYGLMKRKNGSLRKVETTHTMISPVVQNIVSRVSYEVKDSKTCTRKA